MKKKTGLVTGGVVLLLLIVLAGVIIFVDPLVRIALEKGATAALKVPTKVKQASLGLGGKITLTGLAISNPEGFSEPRAVAFEQLDSKTRVGSLVSPVIEVEHLTISKPELTLEFIGERNNWSTLLDNLASSSTPHPKEKKESSGKKFIIRRLRIDGAMARFRSDLIASGGTQVALPAIELQNIGTAEGGASLGEVLELILRALGNSALKAGQGLVPSQLLNRLNSRIEQKVEELEKRSPDGLQKNSEKLKSRTPKIP